MAKDISFLNKLRLMGTIEGISTLLLFFVAMPLKYMAGMPMAVTVVGRIHGFLFVALAVMCVMAIKRVPIGTKLGVMAIIAAIFPFGPFIIDGKLAKVAE